MILTYKWLLLKITAFVIHTTTWLDQAPITITIEDSTHQCNTFLWRANNYIMQHTNYSPEITDQISEFFAHNIGSVDDHNVVWNAHKAFKEIELL